MESASFRQVVEAKRRELKRLLAIQHRALKFRG